MSLTPPLLRLLLLGSLAMVVGGCRPTFTCDPSSATTTVCHAHWACTFTLCSPGQTCTMPFYIDGGVADVTGTGAGTSAPFNFSTAPGSLTGGRFGGDQTCGPTGCSDNLFSLTFQSADLTSSFSTGLCEIKETPAKCAIEGDKKHPIPASPSMPMVTAKLLCKNTIIPCGEFKATADIDFIADVLWPEPPPPPPLPPSPPSRPPAPVSPPPSPAGKGTYTRDACTRNTHHDT